MFDKYELWVIQKTDFSEVLKSYINFYQSIKNLNKKSLKFNYLQDLKYFLYFSKKINNFYFILEKFDINEDEFYKSIIKYLKFIEDNYEFDVIYSSFWLENIYKIDDEIIFLDLDSIKVWDLLYDMVSVLNLVFTFFSSDTVNRYKYYTLVLNYYKKYNSINFDRFKWLLYYYSFRIIIDIDDTKLDTLIRDISSSYNFTKDFNYFLMQNNDSHL